MEEVFVVHETAVIGIDVYYRLLGMVIHLFGNSRAQNSLTFGFRLDLVFLAQSQRNGCTD